EPDQARGAMREEGGVERAADPDPEQRDCQDHAERVDRTPEQRHEHPGEHELHQEEREADDGSGGASVSGGLTGTSAPDQAQSARAPTSALTPAALQRVRWVPSLSSITK